MKKKSITSLLVTMVFAGLVVFASSQVAAEPPPIDAERIIKCTPVFEALSLRFDQYGKLTAAYWCATDSTGACVSPGWQPLAQATGYIKNGGDVRQIINNELLYWCQGPLGGCLGGTCFPKR